MMNQTHENAAIQFRNCCKAYETSGWKSRGRTTRHTVFADLDLTVPVGKTYALLGPSGCGKTTLLKCIIGRLKVDSGTVSIFGNTSGALQKVTGASVTGFMPQETALFTLLTIQETLEYYGKLQGLSNAFVKSQIKFFVAYLKLPHKSTVNNKLSGGQLRRLSFAVAAIHEPKLLIMDEPTVGVDPIIRQRMWQYLRYLMNNLSTTIIITTHYIEEARTTDIVGLMQNGCMLAEGTPNSLMELWNVETLEDLFFKVYSKHLEYESTSNNQTVDSSRPTYEYSTRPTNERRQTAEDVNSSTHEINQKMKKSQLLKQNRLKDTSFLNLSRVTTIVKKNFIRLYRFPFALLFLIFLPAAQMLTVFWALSDMRDIKVGVFNDDAGHFGDMYLNELDAHVITQINYTSNQDGYQDVLGGKLVGFIHVSPNFSDIFMKRFVDVDLLNVDNYKDGLLNVTIDNTDYILPQIFAFKLATAFKDLSDKVLGEIGILSSLATPFLKVSFQPKELINRSVQDSMMPSQLIMFMYVIQVGTSLLFLFLEKESGDMERSLISGATVFEIVIGYAIIQFAVALLQAVVLLSVAFLICKSVLLGSAALTAAITVLSGLGGMSLGLFVSAWLDQLLMIATIGLAVIIGMPALSGTFLPLEAASYPFKCICAFLPFYLPGEAMIDVMYRGLGIMHPEIIIGIAIMLAWILLLVTLAVLCLRSKVR